MPICQPWKADTLTALRRGCQNGALPAAHASFLCRFSAESGPPHAELWVGAREKACLDNECRHAECVRRASILPNQIASTVSAWCHFGARREQLGVRHLAVAVAASVEPARRQSYAASDESQVISQLNQNAMYVSTLSRPHTAYSVIECGPKEKRK